MYNSIFRTLDHEKHNIISNIFPMAKSQELVPIHRQTGGRDCGVYAIAISTTLAFGHDPAKIQFDQSAMRPHLIKCFILSSLDQWLGVQVT